MTLTFNEEQISIIKASLDSFIGTMDDWGGDDDLRYAADVAAEILSMIEQQEKPQEKNSSKVDPYDLRGLEF